MSCHRTTIFYAVLYIGIWKSINIKKAQVLQPKMRIFANIGLYVVAPIQTEIGVG